LGCKASVTTPVKRSGLNVNKTGVRVGYSRESRSKTVSSTV